MEKRLIIAIALSLLVIISFQSYSSKHQPVKPLIPANEMSRAKFPTENVSPEKTPAQTIEPARASNVTEQEYVVETDHATITFSDLGGAIKDIRLKKYSSHGTGAPYELARISNPSEYILSIEDPSQTIPGLNLSLYSLEIGKGIVVYTLNNGKVEVRKSYILDKNQYCIDYRITFKNLTDTPLETNYRVIAGAGVSEPSQQDKRFIEAVSSINGTYTPFKRPNNSRIINKGIVSWAALKNRYFSIILKPFANSQMYYCEQSPENGIVCGIEVENFTLLPNSSVEHRYLLYAGPSDVERLKALNIGLEETVNFGFFSWISKALLWVMKMMNALFRNWGFSIIGLAIFLNIILYPLTAKSFQSIQRMQKLQPEFAKLKEQNKDNPQKLNKEMIELYKKHKVNPFGGCLPLILQMPIFIALYNGLIRSISLKNAPFLWIKDLSQPDALRIPATLPVIGNTVNVLPILMAVAMFAQQKISGQAMMSAQTDEQVQQQKMMMIIMPILFGFIFYSLPSGLVLYWFINTLLTTLEQSVLFKNR